MNSIKYDLGLDIIVANYRTPEDLDLFCDSLSRVKTQTQHRLIIYNVDPEDADRKVALDWQRRFGSRVKVLESRNFGYAHAVNRSAMYGTHDVLAIFNADVQVTRGSLDRCYRELRMHPKWGVLGPRQVDSKGRVTHAGILGERGEAHTHRQWHQRLEQNDDEDRIMNVATVMGSAMFIKRACWDELAQCPSYLDHVYGYKGAMLPTMLYFEETFLCYHAIEHDWKVVYYGPVTMIHEWHKSIDKYVPQDEELRMVAESRRQFNEACDAVHGMPHA